MQTIKPFSQRRRRIQLTLLIIAFVLGGPILVLFASGYSFQDILSTTKIQLLKTGGIYVAEIGTNSIVTIDNKDFKQSSFLDRTVLFQRLTTDIHEIKINRPTYREWSKEVSVYPNRVTEIRPVLIPEDIEVEQVKATSTLIDLRTLLKNKQTVSTTTPEDQDNTNYEIKLDGGDISLSWKSLDDAPYYLCSVDHCVGSTTVYLLETIEDFEWFPGRNDALVVATKSSISIVELDPRNGRIITPIISLADYTKTTTSAKVRPALITYQGVVYFELLSTFFHIDL